MEHTCENCRYAVGWINNKPIMMCDYYRGTVDGRTCYHWKAKDEEPNSWELGAKISKEMDNTCKNCAYAILEGTCFVSNKRIDPNHASCHDFMRRNSIDAEEKTFDPVNSSKHCTSGKVECIDAMIEKFGVEAVKHFCLCNAFKYHWRGDQDIKKAMWYMDKYKELENR